MGNDNHTTNQGGASQRNFATATKGAKYLFIEDNKILPLVKRAEREKITEQQFNDAIKADSAVERITASRRFSPSTTSKA